ncbi:MAG: nucleotide exchange factor GrpE [Thermoanaerobaculia bacterium]|nr:nucleotide exchange factor GrpE [Thermoanaerobaculia bacterium]
MNEERDLEVDLDEEEDEEAEGSGREDTYVLDLDEEADVDEVAREAMEAVERAEQALADDGDDDTTIASLEEELEELRDRSVRTLADFENYRKRAERERKDLRRYARFDTMREFLPIIDNLERALLAGGSAEDLKTGVEMILRQMRDLLRQHGVEAVESLGQTFDPTVHEAVDREETPEVDEATVTEEMQRGYVMHDRLLRPALVKVALPVEEDEEND